MNSLLDHTSIWTEGVLAHAPEDPSIQKFPPSIREILYAALAPAA